MAVIAARAGADHLQQAGYRLDVSDEGRFWLAVDGPHPVSQDDSIVVQAGGSSIRFRITKCSGTVSGFTRTVLR